MGILQTFQALQQAVAAHDIDAVGKFLTADFVLHEPPALPFGGDFYGPKGYLELVGQLQSHFELDVVSSTFTEARSNLLLCELVILFKSKRTGESAEMNVVDLYHFDAQGKICRADGFYMDPDTIAALALGTTKPERSPCAA